MIKRNQAWLNRLNALTDLLLIIASYLFSSWCRLYVFHGFRGNMALTGQMILASVGYAACLLAGLAFAGFYGTTRTRRLRWKLRVLFLSVTAAMLTASALLFVFRREHFSRGVLLLFYIVTLFVLGGKQILMRRMLNTLRARGFNIKHELLVGSGKLARQYRQDVEDTPELGIHIAAAAGPEDEKLDELLACPDFDEVVLALEPEEYGQITRLISACEKHGVRYLVIPFYNDLIPENPVFEHVGRSNMITKLANRLEEISWAALKRAGDLAGAIVGLILFSPLFLLITAGVKLSSPGPVLFVQTRVGYKRREFSMLKFRSLKVNETADTAWTEESDARRTTFGAFIRKTSLDELPQLINVLKGDMSLVGPRPELPHFVEQFKETIPLYMVKHQVKPGMTGWAQVNGFRGDTSIEKRIELDLWYIENWSPLLDIVILFKTFAGAMVNDEKMPRRETKEQR